ncbi:MAG TPA: ATP-binding protein [Puia sp.]
MQTETREELLLKIENLESRLAESEQLIEAIKAGEVDAFAFNTDATPEIYTLQSGDYAYRLLIEEFGEGAVNLSEDGMIVYTNTYFFELLELKYEKVIGRFISEFIAPASMDDFKTIFEKAKNGNSKGEINLQVLDKIIPVFVSLTSLQPNLPTIGMIITDQTEIKKHEEIVLRYQKDLENKNAELAQSNLELDSFSYVASHDLQEPLRKIQTFCQRILETAPEEFSATTHDYFSRILNASKRMQQMINSLLDYSRTNSAQVKTLTDLNEIIKEVVVDQVDEDEIQNVNIRLDTLPRILAIPDQMKQLFNNLVSNAVKYRKADIPLEIHIWSENAGDYWKIVVSDNGIGFEPKYADKIFDLFQRLHSRFEYEGTGIGLSICKKIAQNHKGCIKGIGHPGQGASFEVLLPRNISS